MDKKTTNKRKSLANTNTTPTKIQKIGDTPVSQKKNKSPKSANKNQRTPQKKQQNGKQNTKKEKKKPKQTEEDETELMNESDENETDDSIEQAEDEELSDNSDADESNEDDEEANEEVIANKNKSPKTRVIIPEAERKFSVYVAGFDYKLTESDLENVFDDTNIISVLILKNPGSNKSKGSGFINFKDEASVQKALLKDGTEIKGRKIKVNLPMKKDQQTDAKSKKKLLLQKIESDVQNLEKELTGTGKKNKFEKPTNNADKKNNVKFNKKKNTKKTAVKQE